MSTSRSRDNLLALLYFQQYRAGAEQDFRASVISVALTEHVSPLPEQRYEQYEQYESTNENGRSKGRKLDAKS